MIRNMFIAAILFLSASAYSKEMYLKQEAICNDNPLAILTFLTSMKLQPLMGGGGKTLSESDNYEDVATVLFVNDENKLAIMQYYHDRICLVGVIGNIIYDEKELREFTRMDK